MHSPRSQEEMDKGSMTNAEIIAYELGYEYERKYGACSQCTILAIMDSLGKRNADVFRASFGFAGGIGNLSEMCGALSAGIMMIGLENGRDLEHIDTQTEDEKRYCMQMVRELHQLYIAEYGSTKCADVHMRIFGRSFDQWDADEFQEFLRMGGHVDKCTAVVGNVARWTVEILSREGQRTSAERP
jgi:C_GCAxxG_C_C family probable redox protein